MIRENINYRAAIPVTYSQRLKRRRLLTQAFQWMQYQRANPVYPTVFETTMQRQPHTFFFDVNRSVYVPVVIRPALRTNPISYRQVLCFNIFIPAIGTKLTAGKKFVHLDQLFACFFQFVLQKTDKHSPAIIRDRFAKMQCLCHRFHVEVFYTDPIMNIGHLPWLFVQKILALIGNLLVYSGHTNSLFFRLFEPFSIRDSLCCSRFNLCSERR